MQRMKNVLEFLEKTAKRDGWKTAADDGNICMTWAELWDLSMRLGSAFCHRTVPGKPVIILMDKKVITLAAMFGAVYAGCFYTVIDPGQPPLRIREIFRLLKTEMVFTDHVYEELLKQIGYSGQILTLRMAIREKTESDVLMDVRKKSRETDLLYCMFTSGSTGTPKGIVVNHKAVIDFISRFTELFHFGTEDRIGNQAPFDFDISVKDIYTCVFTGATLVLIPEKLFSTPPVLLDYLCEKQINTLIWAVSALTMLSSLGGLEYRVPVDVKKVFFSGEVMPVNQLTRWQRALPEASFINLYGPAEITCNCTWYPVPEEVSGEVSIPIGRALPGRKVFLLNDEGCVLTNNDEGETGEICVAGESLSEGYFRDPEETKRKFRVCPETKERFYCTGDLGYFGKDGELYFAGRKDFQIKHMGHRIELEEIEYQMDQIDGVEDSCCFLQPKNRILTAVYVGDVSEKMVKETIKKCLPKYMIPQKIRQTDKFPLTKNGKKDRRVLAERFGE